MNAPRDIAGFLAASGWAGAERSPLAGDASARRYERLRDGRRGALLMDVPPESGLDIRPYLEVTDWLRGAGFSAPEILAADTDTGLALIEDMGDALLLRLCAEDRRREAGLYSAAIDLLAALQALPPPGARGGWSPPPYDMELLLREVRLVTEWYLPAATGQPAAAELAEEYAALARETFTPVLAAPAVAVLRDYHAENLIWLPERRGHARIGLLDYQDMLRGHPAYDLISLLEDARRDTGAALRRDMLARYNAQTGADAEAMAAAAHVLAAQRNLKILGLFTRLCRRDGKPRYLDFLPRVWAHLERDLAHPATARLGAFVQRHLPPPEAEVRARITGLAA